MSAKPVAPLVLSEEKYLLARNDDRFALYLPLEPDDFGTVAFERLAPNKGPGVGIGTDSWTFYIDPLIQQLGTYIEKCAALEAALQKAGG